MVFLIQQTMLYAVPLMIVALAGVCAERSGVINLALEGIMIFGAFMGVVFVRIFQEAGWTQDQGQIIMIISLFLTGICGIAFSMLLAFSAINLRADQTIGGTALNMLAPAIVMFFIYMIVQQNTMGMASGGAAGWFMIKPQTFGLPKGHSWGPIIDLFINKVYLTTYICIIIFVLVSIFLYKTKTGLRLRSCGENPQAADSLGINVHKMRYLGVGLSGFLAGVGGFTFSMTTANMTSNGDVAGYGFLALAVMIFGNWTPLNIAFGSILFGLFKCIAATYATLDINGDGVYTLNELGISPYVYRMLPYIITLIVLAFTSKSSRVPKAEGIPYDKGQR
ncbi:MAG: ABC transporter permease [Firmicutes bacterium]|jgi:simple sugar transport system permease protein|nr:ABC transporter permease [Bacillota bacterium]MCR4709141.1 ABC transporter permease [Clostridiales bacterium]